MRRLLLVTALSLLVLTGCGTANTVTSSVSGKPIKIDMGDGVTCYVYGERMSCVYGGQR